MAVNREYIKQGLNFLREIEKEYLLKLQDVRRTISHLVDDLNSNRNENDILINESNSAGDINEEIWATKNREIIDPIVDAIRKEGRFLYKQEIELLIKPVKDLSSALSIAKKKKKRGIANYTPEGAQKLTVWGFDDWLDEEGKPKSEYAPQPKQKI